MMKKVKKFASMMLALVMSFVMAIPVFAAGEPKAVPDKYQIFQIFTGDYHQGVLSNVKWGLNGNGGTQGQAVSDTILKELQDVKDATADTEKLAVITKYVNLSSTPYITGDATKYENLPNGYYLVRNTPDTQNGENDFYTLYVVQVVNGTLEFSPKGDVPETEKKIVEGQNRVDINEASIGDAVNYEITGTLPTNFADYKTYYYEFTDNLSKGLTYNSDMSVTIGGVDVTRYFYIGATDYNQTTGTIITVAIRDLKALNYVEGVTVDKDSKIILTYSATLNQNAVIAGEGNPNDVKLKYSNDPNNSGTGTEESPEENPERPTPENPTGETPKDEVKTYTTELTILKNDENSQILAGAEFTLTGNGASAVKTVDSVTGLATFSGLGAGTYTITETKTPAGYNTIAPITFTLTFDTDTKMFVSDNSAVTVGNDNKLDITIINKSGTQLPSTGGIGTTIFYVIGTILVLAAAVLLITKKRMGEKN